MQTMYIYDGKYVHSVSGPISKRDITLIKKPKNKSLFFAFVFSAILATLIVNPTKGTNPMPNKRPITVVERPN
jgi:hypothetical protein